MEFDRRVKRLCRIGMPRRLLQIIRVRSSALCLADFLSFSFPSSLTSLFRRLSHSNTLSSAGQRPFAIFSLRIPPFRARHPRFRLYSRAQSAAHQKTLQVTRFTLSQDCSFGDYVHVRANALADAEIKAATIDCDFPSFSLITMEYYSPNRVIMQTSTTTTIKF